MFTVLDEQTVMEHKHMKKTEVEIKKGDQLNWKHESLLWKHENMV
jgi:hypothetical protein